MLRGLISARSIFKNEKKKKEEEKGASSTWNRVTIIENGELTLAEIAGTYPFKYWFAILSWPRANWTVAMDGLSLFWGSTT